MVGQADSTTELLHTQHASLLNIRELIILTLGLVDKPLSVEEAYTMVKNLEVRIRSIMAYKLPDQDIFRSMITKMVKNFVVTQQYSLIRRKYVVQLSESGEGEFDYLLHSIANKKLIQIFDEYKGLIDLFY